VRPVRHAEPGRRRLLPGLGHRALPVPDVIEEMVSRILEDGGEVVVICDGSFPVAARMSGHAAPRTEIQ
jgi:hypothetical protein